MAESQHSDLRVGKGVLTSKSVLSRPTLYQVALFLSCNPPRSSEDGDILRAYIHRRFGTLPRVVKTEGEAEGSCVLDPNIFSECLESCVWPMNVVACDDLIFLTGRVYLQIIDDACYTCFDILFPCRMRSEELGKEEIVTLERLDTEYMAGKTPTNLQANLQNASISHVNGPRNDFQAEDDKLFIPCPKTPSEALKTLFLNMMLEDALQPDLYNLRLCRKYKPKINERVCFYDFKMDLRGVGVVRDVTRSGDVSFHCYFTYPDEGTDCFVGYECGDPFSVSLCSCNFESLETPNTDTMLGKSSSCLRRLSTELEKHGKVWRNRLLRVEPLGYDSERGRRYWFITDKMTVQVAIDKGTLLHSLRYRCGNYFLDRNGALKALDFFRRRLEGYLASPSWPAWMG